MNKLSVIVVIIVATLVALLLALGAGDPRWTFPQGYSEVYPVEILVDEECVTLGWGMEAENCSGKTLVLRASEYADESYEICIAELPNPEPKCVVLTENAYSIQIPEASWILEIGPAPRLREEPIDMRYWGVSLVTPEDACAIGSTSIWCPAP